MMNTENINLSLTTEEIAQFLGPTAAKHLHMSYPTKVTPYVGETMAMDWLTNPSSIWDIDMPVSNVNFKDRIQEIELDLFIPDEPDEDGEEDILFLAV